MNTAVERLLKAEEERQHTTLGMIPSENYTSPSVRKAVGSVFMNKYAEGYPFARYYEGNEIVDQLESLCIKMVKKVMGVDETEWHANVQVLSGSMANLSVYNAMLKPGDKILSMYLPDGGHLSHGWSYSPKKDKVVQEGMVYRGGTRKVNITSRLYDIVQYRTDPETTLFDYDFIEKLAIEEKPKLIITGGTAYPRDIDYSRMRKIADKVGALYMADVAHEAGLIAGGAVSSPFEYADFVTFTTHKTLRGPRGAVVMCRSKYASKIDKAVFPGMQGGPFEHSIAGLTQALFEADTPEFKTYAKQVVINAQVLASELMRYKFKIVTGGTDKHLVLADVTSLGLNGAYLARALALAGIIANKNTIPYEKGSPVHPSGVRFGTPILTTRGMKESEIKEIAKWINEMAIVAKEYMKEDFEAFQEKVLNNPKTIEIRERVSVLCRKFPLE